LKAETLNLRQTWPRAFNARERGCEPASRADEAGGQLAGTGGCNSGHGQSLAGGGTGADDRRRTSPLHSNECSITGLCQEPRVDERSEERVTHIAVQTPQALGLSGSEPKSGHLQEFTLDPLKHIVDAHAFTSVRFRSRSNLLS
jgi:hypothetical protein